MKRSLFRLLALRFCLPYVFGNRIFDERDVMRPTQIKTLVLNNAVAAVLALMISSSLGCQPPASYWADNRPVPQGSEFESERVAIAERCRRAKRQLEVFENNSLGPDWLDIAAERIERLLTLDSKD